jgi:two-component system, NtrC family, response regulator HydG
MSENKYTKLDSSLAGLLLEAMAEGVFTLDNNGTITSWNPSMERITGYARDEAIGKNCQLLNFNNCFGKTCPTGIMECEIIKHGNFDGKECFLTHKNGHDVPILKSARLINDEGGIFQGIVETVSDLGELYTTRQRLAEAAELVRETHSYSNIIGKGSEMQQVFSALKSAALSEATVLISGASGTGKELAAKAIHFNGNRSNMPYVAVNCSALPETLLESELFGHIKGAFTGAINDRVGRFEEAGGGTLFLDEIADISPLIQLKLLRVIQEREIERVGESKKRKIDVRIIAATNKDLFSLVNSGDYREDLFYRLKVFPISLPAVQKRKEDVPLLISHFINLQNQKTGKLVVDVTPAAMRILLDYNWPGNVRELENAIEHAFVLVHNKYIDIFDLPVEIRQFEFTQRLSSASSDESQSQVGRKLTRESLLEVLTAADWNKAEVGRRLGISRTAVWKHMKKWEIPLEAPE